MGGTFDLLLKRFDFRFQWDGVLNDAGIICFQIFIGLGEHILVLFQ
jgi:hypothetical protein